MLRLTFKIEGLTRGMEEVHAILHSMPDWRKNGHDGENKNLL